jgi:hypothetical protein
MWAKVVLISTTVLVFSQVKRQTLTYCRGKVAISHIIHCLQALINKETNQIDQKGSFLLNFDIKIHFFMIFIIWVANGEFVIIDNATYFMDMVTGFHREDAKTTCESLNMTMIRFEGEEQKWLAIKKYFTEEGKKRCYVHQTKQFVNICV